MNTRTAPAPRRLAIFSRVAAAILGGYLLAATSSVFLSHLFPASLPEAVLGATLFSFAIYTAAIVWAFALPTAGQAWLAMLLPSTLLGIAAGALQLIGGAV